MILVSSCCCLCPTHWSQVLSREWRCCWSSADRRCSNYIWVIDNFIAFYGASYIRDLTVNSPLLIGEEFPRWCYNGDIHSDNERYYLEHDPGYRDTVSLRFRRSWLEISPSNIVFPACRENQGSFGIWAQSMRDDVTMLRRFSLAESISKMIPENLTLVICTYCYGMKSYLKLWGITNRFSWVIQSINGPMLYDQWIPLTKG